MLNGRCALGGLVWMMLLLLGACDRSHPQDTQQAKRPAGDRVTGGDVGVHGAMPAPMAASMDEQRALQDALRIAGAALMSGEHQSVLQRLAAGMEIVNIGKRGFVFERSRRYPHGGVGILERNVRGTDVVLLRTVLDSIGSRRNNWCRTVELIDQWFARLESQGVKEMEADQAAMDADEIALMEYMVSLRKQFEQWKVGAPVEFGRWPSVRTASYYGASDVLVSYMLNDMADGMDSISTGIIFAESNGKVIVPVWSGYDRGLDSSNHLTVEAARIVDLFLLGEVAALAPDRSSPAGQEAMNHMRVWVDRVERGQLDQLDLSAVRSAKKYIDGR